MAIDLTSDLLTRLQAATAELFTCSVRLNTEGWAQIGHGGEPRTDERMELEIMVNTLSYAAEIAATAILETVGDDYPGVAQYEAFLENAHFASHVDDDLLDAIREGGAPLTLAPTPPKDHALVAVPTASLTVIADLLEAHGLHAEAAGFRPAPIA